MRKEHALHNEELCDFLLNNGKYNDWVITTAFYSALNFVKHEMFPLNLPGIGKYEDFESYYKKHGHNQDKHDSLKDLVSRNMQCGGAYRWLLDNCKTARYNDYKISADNAKKARSLLEAVKSHCKKS